MRKGYYFWGVYIVVFCIYLLVIIGYMIMESIKIFSSEPSLRRLTAAGYIFYIIPIFSIFLLSFVLAAINFFRCKDSAWMYIFILSLVYIIFSCFAQPFNILIIKILYVTGNPEGLLQYWDTIYLMPLFIIGCYRVFNLIKHYRVKK